MLRNTPLKYGFLAKLFHWLSAIIIVVLFALGLWMVDLDYYHNWYTEAPALHISLGLLLIALTLVRLIWKKIDTDVDGSNETRLHSKLVVLGHSVLYVLIVATLFTGYLIASGDGKSILFFDLMQLPALPFNEKDTIDLAGEVHEFCAFSLVILACGHGIVALKRQWLDKDGTLNKML